MTIRHCALLSYPFAPISIWNRTQKNRLKRTQTNKWIRSVVKTEDSKFWSRFSNRMRSSEKGEEMPNGYYGVGRYRWGRFYLPLEVFIDVRFDLSSISFVGKNSHTFTDWSRHLLGSFKTSKIYWSMHLSIDEGFYPRLWRHGGRGVLCRQAGGGQGCIHPPLFCSLIRTHRWILPLASLHICRTFFFCRKTLNSDKRIE